MCRTGTISRQPDRRVVLGEVDLNIAHVVAAKPHGIDGRCERHEVLVCLLPNGSFQVTPWCMNTPHSRFNDYGFLHKGMFVTFGGSGRLELEGACSPELLGSKWVNEDAVEPQLDAIPDLAQHHRHHTRILCGSTKGTIKH